MAKSPMPSFSAANITELRKRLIFVFAALLVFRVGAHIPVPGLDPVRLAQLFGDSRNSLLGMFNLFTGGALSRVTLFALGIMPYISASIIMQLLSAVYPHFQELRKEGGSGRRKITQYTRIGTVILASFQAFGMARYLAASGIALYPGPVFFFTTSVSLVTGTMFLMWLGEQMTERGVGNGISLIIFAGIVAGLPRAIGNTFEQVRQGLMQPIILVLLALIVAAVTAFVVFIERGQRRITVNYAKRQVGNQMMAANKSHLPLKINMAGVIPPIFASSIILFPATLSKWFAQTPGFEWLNDVGFALSHGQPVHMLVFSIAIIFFCFFYTALVFNPQETADNLKRSGAFIPGIRPGDSTSQYIDKIMTRLTLVGALYITLVAILPDLLIMAWSVPFYFGGTSLLIIVVVIMDFIAQIQAHLLSHQYDSLMKKTKLRGK